MSADPTIPDPTTPVPAPNGQLPPGLPELCAPDGHTWQTVIPCGPENPTIEQACQQDAYRAVLDCTAYPKQVLPHTGSASVPIAGAGFAFVAIGAILVRKVAAR